MKGRKILLGVTGGIAAYKMAELTRLFVKAGAEFKVIMTESACEFITPLTLSALSRNPVLRTFSNKDDGTWNSHVELGIWADLMLIAPATANTIARMAHGFCDNLLTAVYLSARCPVFFAPAMDLDMYSHRVTRENMDKLRSLGIRQIGPATGELASGLVGEGRMEEPGFIFSTIEKFFREREMLKGKIFLVSAGPTREAIDPVRYISNHSSGKMGFEIAASLADRGAEVIIIAGPSEVKTPRPEIKRVDVRSAAEMHAACLKEFSRCDAAIMAAAVADYTPLKVSERKIKKSDAPLTIEVKATVDILAEMGKKKRKNQVLIGFALETNDEITHAVKKLESKNLDYVILNSTRDSGAAFHSDNNKITIIDRKKNKISFPLKSKHLVAEDIIQTIFHK